jgi:hypothetical protein
MGIIAWIALGMAVGLLVNMLLPGKRSRALIFLCLTCFTGVLAASLFRVHGLFSFLCPARRPRRSNGPAAGLPPAHHPSARAMR